MWHLLFHSWIKPPFGLIQGKLKKKKLVWLELVFAGKIHQKTPTAIKPIANSTYQKPNHNNNNSQIQHTKNPITTTTIHKFSISKTQTQQQYTNSTHNNIPKTHWIQTSQHSKNQSTKTHFNIPSAKPISPLEAKQPKSQFSNPKRRRQRGPNPNNNAAVAPNGQTGHCRRHPR